MLYCVEYAGGKSSGYADANNISKFYILDTDDFVLEVVTGLEVANALEQGVTIEGCKLGDRLKRTGKRIKSIYFNERSVCDIFGSSVFTCGTDDLVICAKLNTFIAEILTVDVWFKGYYYCIEGANEKKNRYSMITQELWVNGKNAMSTPLGIYTLDSFGKYDDGLRLSISERTLFILDGDLSVQGSVFKDLGIPMSRATFKRKAIKGVV